MGVKGRLYTTGDIADLLGVTRQRAYAIANRKGFPDTFDEWTGGPSVWLTEDVDRWIAENRPTRAEDPEGE